MNKYTIYCTEEQTIKALELDAPIENIQHYASINKYYVSGNYMYDNGKCYFFPTADQMIGWLDENLPETHDIAIEYKIEKGKWVYFIGWRESEPIYNSRKEATLAAIDAALDYLIRNKTLRM